MTRQELRISNTYSDKQFNDIYDDTYNEDSFIDEECYCCGRHLTNTRDILVDTERDVYVCKGCSEKHNIPTVPCADLD